MTSSEKLLRLCFKSKLWILVADWSMRRSRDTLLIKLRLYNLLFLKEIREDKCLSNLYKKPKGKFLNQFCHIVTPSFINCANQMHWLNGSNCSVIKVKIQMFFYAAGNAQNKDQFESIFFEPQFTVCCILLHPLVSAYQLKWMVLNRTLHLSVRKYVINERA